MPTIYKDRGNHFCSNCKETFSQVKVQDIGDDEGDGQGQLFFCPKCKTWRELK